MRRRQPSLAAFLKNPVTPKQSCAADVSAPSHPFYEKGESTTRGLGLPLVWDSLKLASSTSSSTSKLRLVTNVKGAAYAEEITRRYGHSHAGFDARGHHLF